MKPAPFQYFAPASLSEGLSLLGQYGDEAKILAGGQSLMPLMNMRLARPKVVVDINRIAGLAHIEAGGEGGLVVGALTRQRQVEKSSLVRERAPLLSGVMPYIGHSQIRNRGTIGGSLAHGDPAAELAAVSLAMGAEMVLARTGGERVVKADEFFVGQLATALEPEEMLTQVRIPGAAARWQWGFQEVCRRAGDFALVGAVALLRLDGGGVSQLARIVVFGAAATPVRIYKAEEALLGTRVESKAREEAAQLASQELDPVSDIHASAAYRKKVGGVMVRRALEEALARMEGDTGA